MHIRSCPYGKSSNSKSDIDFQYGDSTNQGTAGQYLFDLCPQKYSKKLYIIEFSVTKL